MSESILDKEVQTWLLSSTPWTEYRVRLDLLGQAESDPQVLAARSAMLAHPQIRGMIEELSEWPGPALKRHNDASHLLHKLVFLADIGVKVSDEGMRDVVEKVLSCRSLVGMFQVVANISPNYGGTGRDQLTWMLCDSPSVLYALAKMGLHDDGRLHDAAVHLAGMVSENGWHCAVALELGRFRGPGRKTDPCPYATLVTLKALAQFPEWRESEAARLGAECLLNLWERRKETKPYLFGMGTDFQKLKAPLVWYDLFHVLHVLDAFEGVQSDPRLLEMKDILRQKADASGKFTPESVWMAWKEWDFGQKKSPSAWLTFLAYRVL